MASDEMWLQAYDSCVQQGQQIMQMINERNRQDRNTTKYTKLSSQIRTLLRQFSAEVDRLRTVLMRASSTSSMTMRELDRRQGMMDELVTREKQLDQAFKNERAQMGRTALLDQGPLGNLSQDTWGVRNPEDDMDMPIDNIRQQQQQVIQEQDLGLDALSHVLSRQKQMALDIGNEVESQNDLIDDITDHTDTTNTRLIKETRHIKIVDRKSGSCVYWVLIGLVALAIVIIPFLPVGKHRI